jgi:hypothetical protein
MGKLNNFYVLHNVFNHYHRINIDWNKISLNKRCAMLNFVLSEAIQPFSDYVLDTNHHFIFSEIISEVCFYLISLSSLVS